MPWPRGDVMELSRLLSRVDLYTQAQDLAVETMRGYQGNDRAGALGTVLGEMLKEALKAGVSVAALTRELHDLEHWLSVQPKENQ